MCENCNVLRERVAYLERMISDSQKAGEVDEVRRARKAMGLPDMIETISGTGYRMSAAGREEFDRRCSRARIPVEAMNDDEDVPLGVAIATLVGRHANLVGLAETKRVMRGIEAALGRQYGQ